MGSCIGTEDLELVVVIAAIIVGFILHWLLTSTRFHWVGFLWTGSQRKLQASQSTELSREKHESNVRSLPKDKQVSLFIFWWWAIISNGRQLNNATIFKSYGQQVPFVWTCVFVGYWLCIYPLFVWPSILHDICVKNRNGNCEEIINLSVIKREVKDMRRPQRHFVFSSFLTKRCRDTVTACFKLKNLHAKNVEIPVCVYIYMPYHTHSMMNGSTRNSDHVNI
jgi:hypothetical protein